jgi:large subunit ribosomal protein L24
VSVKLKKDRREPVRIQLKKNDQVKVIAGRDRGKTGRILDVDSSTGRIYVEHVNMVKKHTKKNPAKQIAGGIAEKEGPIAVSNVMIVCGKCGPVRIKKHVEKLAGGVTRRTRVCHKCGLSLDKK